VDDDYLLRIASSSFAFLSGKMKQNWYFRRLPKGRTLLVKGMKLLMK